MSSRLPPCMRVYVRVRVYVSKRSSRLFSSTALNFVSDRAQTRKKKEKEKREKAGTIDRRTVWPAFTEILI